MDVGLEGYLPPILVLRETDDVAQEPDELGEVGLEFLWCGCLCLTLSDCHTSCEVSEYTTEEKRCKFTL